MESHAADITGVALVIAVAVALGLVLTRLRQPALVGYIAAGVVLGPTGFALIERSEAVGLLAELGVLMLLFIIGMELSLKAFVRVLRPATIVVSGQIIAALVISGFFGLFMDWSARTAILFGFIIAISSTAVALKMLEQIGELRTSVGQITIGIVIAQDLAVIPMLIIVESFGESTISYSPLIIRIFVALGLLGAVIVFFSRRGKINIPALTGLTASVDITTLGTLAICFTAAAISGILGLSPPYGAFLAGLIIANSTIRADAVRVTEPIQSLLLVIFFLSIGLLIDLNYIAQHLLSVFLLAAGVIALKTGLNVALLRAVGEPWERAFPAGLITAQIGEFSFILAAAGLSRGALDGDTYQLAISVIAVSLLVSPIWMTSVQRFHDIAQTEVVSLRSALGEIYEGEIRKMQKVSAFTLNLLKVAYAYVRGRLGN